MKIKTEILFLTISLIFSACSHKLINGVYIVRDYHPYELIIYHDTFSDTLHTSLGKYYGEGKYNVRKNNIITFHYNGSDTIKSEIILTNEVEVNSDTIKCCIYFFDKKTKENLHFVNISIFNSIGELVFSDYMKDTVEQNCFYLKNSNDPLFLETTFVGYKVLRDTIYFNKNKNFEIYLSQKEFFNKTENGVIHEYKIIRANNKKLKFKTLDKEHQIIEMEKIK